MSVYEVLAYCFLTFLWVPLQVEFWFENGRREHVTVPFLVSFSVEPLRVRVREVHRRISCQPFSIYYLGGIKIDINAIKCNITNI